MAYIFTVIKGNFRKSKGVYFSIFLLMLIVSVALCSVLTYYTNSQKRDMQVMEENGFGDMLAALYSDQKLKEMNTDADTIIKNTKQCDAVSKVQVSDVFYVAMKNCKGKKGNSSVFLLSEQDPNLHYTQYDAKNQISRKPLKKGEISVPISYVGLYHCKIGDTVELGGDTLSYSYKIASFFEDPYMGSAMMGIKTLLLSENDFSALRETSKTVSEKQEEVLQNAHLLSIKKNPHQKLSAMKFEQKLNKVSDVASYCWISLSKEQAVKYMLLLSNIFSGVLMVFIVMLLLAAMIVLGHNISSSITLDYQNIGILKAVGMKNGAIRLALLLGYLGAVITGLLIGIPLSFPVIRYINQETLSSSGLYLSARLSGGRIALVLFGILLLVTLFIAVRTRQLSKITPLKAIHNGQDSVHFSSVLRLPISHRLLNISLVYRQFVSEKRQYVAAIIVTAILTAFLIMVNDLGQWTSSPDMLSDIFSVTKADLYAGYSKDTKQKEAESVIRKYSDFEKYRMGSCYLLFDDVMIYCYVIDDPEQIDTVKKGRTCRYENEILITQYIADQFHLDLGDKITIKMNGEKQKMIVSGIYESANDTGKNLTINYKAYRKMVKGEQKSNSQWGYVYYQLKKPEQTDAILKAVKKQCGTGSSCSIKSNKEEDESMKMIAVAVQGLTMLVYVLGAIFVVITVFIVCGKIIVRERKDFGIYKAIGFVSVKLRLQLAVRFAVTAFLGAILGVFLTLLVSQSFFNVLFSSFGIYSYESRINLASCGTPILFMSVLFAVCAFFKAGKVKKIQPQILIADQ